MPKRLLPLAAATAFVILFATACETTTAYLRADGSLDAGRVYARKCSQCHALYDPRDFSDEDWENSVRTYAPRAGLRPEWRQPVIDWLKRANDDGV